MFARITSPFDQAFHTLDVKLFAQRISRAASTVFEEFSLFAAGVTTLPKRCEFRPKKDVDPESSLKVIYEFTGITQEDAGKFSAFYISVCNGDIRYHLSYNQSTDTYIFEFDASVVATHFLPKIQETFASALAGNEPKLDRYKEQSKNCKEVQLYYSYDKVLEYINLLSSTPNKELIEEAQALCQGLSSALREYVITCRILHEGNTRQGKRKVIDAVTEFKKFTQHEKCVRYDVDQHACKLASQLDRFLFSIESESAQYIIAPPIAIPETMTAAVLPLRAVDTLN